jgi:hypothetical protein
VHHSTAAAPMSERGRISGLVVDHQMELRRLLHWQVGGALAGKVSVVATRLPSARKKLLSSPLPRGHLDKVETDLRAGLSVQE